MWRKMVALATFGGLVVGGSAAGRVHTVRRGETLEAIGRTYGVAVPALAAANGLRDPNRVLAGTTLTIPPPGPAGIGLAAQQGLVDPGRRRHAVDARHRRLRVPPAARHRPSRPPRPRGQHPHGHPVPALPARQPRRRRRPRPRLVLPGAAVG